MESLKFVNSHKLFMERLDKIALHEIGHNLGLEHCTNDPQCMMCNANGNIMEVIRSGCGSATSVEKY